MGRRRKNEERFSDNGVTVINNDTGFIIMDCNKGINRYNETNDISFFSDQIVLAFKNNIIVNLSSYWLNNGDNDLYNGRVYIENMGFEIVSLLPNCKMFEPWQNDDLYWLKSWSPGLNVDKFSCWSKFEKNTPRSQQVEHIDQYFNRHDKYNIDKFFEENDQYNDGDEVPYASNLDDKLASNGLYSVEGGDKFKYQESKGFLYNGVLYNQNIVRIEKAELS